MSLNVFALDVVSKDKDSIANLIKQNNVNLIFIALHGEFGEDGQIQSILDDLDIPFTGSGVLASQIAMDKSLSRRYFLEKNLNVPESVMLDKFSYNKEKLSFSFNFPVVVKPATQGSSLGLSIVESFSSLDEAVMHAFGYDDKVLIENYIKGREFTVGILEDRSLPIIEIVPKSGLFDYEAKYKPGMTDYIVPAQIEEQIAQKIKEAALIAHKALGCFGYSRVDLILDEGKTPVVLEVNTIPGMTETSLLPKAALNIGIDFPELCRKLLTLAIDEKKK
jgi:D-alanine--D-alanine ligase